jgi:hypothetical protein
MLKVCLIALLVFGLALAIQPAVFAKHDKACKRPNEPPKKLGTPANPFDKTVKEDARPGVVYLALVGGGEPNPNDCGLKPKNVLAEWTGWGGPLDADNMTIGEGLGTRNDIVIGGIYYERGIGTHSVGKMVYDLSGKKYVKFEAWAGMADEKDGGKCAAPECGHGGSGAFVFSIGGKEVLTTPVLKGCDGGKNVAAFEVKFDIPAGAKELQIDFTNGGDGGGCDHSALGDAKLLTPEALAIESKNKLPATWGDIKRSY